MNKDHVKIGTYDDDDAKPGLRAIGFYKQEKERTFPSLYQSAVAGEIAGGSSELIGHLEGLYSAADRFTVTRFVREGKRILANVQYVKASPDKRRDKRAYVHAKLPEGLPPGRYYVKVQMVESLRQDGRMAVAPRDSSRAFEYLTCVFDVPPGETPGKPDDRPLPGSDRSPEKEENIAFSYAAVCEAVIEAPSIVNLPAYPRHRTVQDMKVVEALAGQVKAGDQVRLQYEWTDGFQRPAAKGERLIWLVRGDHGEKALPDTPENRKLLAAAAIVPATPRESPDGQQRGEQEQGKPDKPAGGEWSAAVNGLQARLVLKRTEVVNGTPIISTYLELRNVSDGGPILLQGRNVKQDFKVIDADGRSCLLRPRCTSMERLVEYRAT